MTDIQTIIDNYDYFNQPMVNENDKLTSLDALIAAIGINSEIDFFLEGTRWYLGPSDSGYILSKDNGNWKKSFNNINEILDYKINNKSIKKNWNKILVNDL